MSTQSQGKTFPSQKRRTWAAWQQTGPTSLKFLDTCFLMSVPLVKVFSLSIPLLAHKISLTPVACLVASWSLDHQAFSFFFLHILSLGKSLNLPTPLFTNIISCTFQNWWGDLRVLEWSAEGETRKSNVKSGRKTNYHILSHIWNEDLTRTARCHQSRNGVSHGGGS